MVSRTLERPHAPATNSVAPRLCASKSRPFIVAFSQLYVIDTDAVEVEIVLQPPDVGIVDLEI